MPAVSSMTRTLFSAFSLFLLLLGLLISSSHASSSSSHGICTYSFFFLSYRQPFAARLVFDRVRQFYPTAPIYIMTDKGGIDLSSFCHMDRNCRSTISSLKFGHAFKLVHEPFTAHLLQQLYTFYDYMADAAEWGNCEFMLLIEEDVWFNRQLLLADRPLGDAGGGNNNKTNDR